MYLRTILKERAKKVKFINKVLLKNYDKIWSQSDLEIIVPKKTKFLKEQYRQHLGLKKKNVQNLRCGEPWFKVSKWKERRKFMITSWHENIMV